MRQDLNDVLSQLIEDLKHLEKEEILGWQQKLEGLNLPHGESEAELITHLQKMLDLGTDYLVLEPELSGLLDLFVDEPTKQRKKEIRNQISNLRDEIENIKNEQKLAEQNQKTKKKRIKELKKEIEEITNKLASADDNHDDETYQQNAIKVREETNQKARELDELHKNTPTAPSEELKEKINNLHTLLNNLSPLLEAFISIPGKNLTEQEENFLGDKYLILDPELSELRVLLNPNTSLTRKKDLEQQINKAQQELDIMEEEGKKEIKGLTATLTEEIHELQKGGEGKEEEKKQAYPSTRFHPVIRFFNPTNKNNANEQFSLEDESEKAKQLKSKTEEAAKAILAREHELKGKKDAKLQDLERLNEQLAFPSNLKAKLIDLRNKVEQERKRIAINRVRGKNLPSILYRLACITADSRYKKGDEVEAIVNFIREQADRFRVNPKDSIPNANLISTDRRSFLKHLMLSYYKLEEEGDELATRIIDNEVTRSLFTIEDFDSLLKNSTNNLFNDGLIADILKSAEQHFLDQNQRQDFSILEQTSDHPRKLSRLSDAMSQLEASVIFKNKSRPRIAKTPKQCADLISQRLVVLLNDGLMPDSRSLAQVYPDLFESLNQFLRTLTNPESEGGLGLTINDQNANLIASDLPMAQEEQKGSAGLPPSGDFYIRLSEVDVPVYVEQGKIIGLCRNRPIRKVRLNNQSPLDLPDNILLSRFFLPSFDHPIYASTRSIKTATNEQRLAQARAEKANAKTGTKNGATYNTVAQSFRVGNYEGIGLALANSLESLEKEALSNQASSVTKEEIIDALFEKNKLISSRSAAIRKEFFASYTQQDLVEGTILKEDYLVTAPGDKQLPLRDTVKILLEQAEEDQIRNNKTFPNLPNEWPAEDLAKEFEDAVAAHPILANSERDDWKPLTSNEFTDQAFQGFLNALIYATQGHQTPEDSITAVQQAFDNFTNSRNSQISNASQPNTWNTPENRKLLLQYLMLAAYKGGKEKQAYSPILSHPLVMSLLTWKDLDAAFSIQVTDVPGFGKPEIITNSLLREVDYSMPELVLGTDQREKNRDLSLVLQEMRASSYEKTNKINKSSPTPPTWRQCASEVGRALWRIQSNGLAHKIEEQLRDTLTNFLGNLSEAIITASGNAGNKIIIRPAPPTQQPPIKQGYLNLGAIEILVNLNDEGKITGPNFNGHYGFCLRSPIGAPDQLPDTPLPDNNHTFYTATQQIISTCERIALAQLTDDDAKDLIALIPPTLLSIKDKQALEEIVLRPVGTKIEYDLHEMRQILGFDGTANDFREELLSKAYYALSQIRRKKFLEAPVRPSPNQAPAQRDILQSIIGTINRILPTNPLLAGAPTPQPPLTASPSPNLQPLLDNLKNAAQDSKTPEEIIQVIKEFTKQHNNPWNTLENKKLLLQHLILVTYKREDVKNLNSKIFTDPFILSLFTVEAVESTLSETAQTISQTTIKLAIHAIIKNLSPTDTPDWDNSWKKGDEHFDKSGGLAVILLQMRNQIYENNLPTTNPITWKQCADQVGKGLRAIHDQEEHQHAIKPQTSEGYEEYEELATFVRQLSAKSQPRARGIGLILNDRNSVKLSETSRYITLGTMQVLVTVNNKGEITDLDKTNPLWLRPVSLLFPHPELGLPDKEVAFGTTSDHPIYRTTRQIMSYSKATKEWAPEIKKHHKQQNLTFNAKSGNNRQPISFTPPPSTTSDTIPLLSPTTPPLSSQITTPTRTTAKPSGSTTPSLPQTTQTTNNTPLPLSSPSLTTPKPSSQPSALTRATAKPNQPTLNYSEDHAVTAGQHLERLLDANLQLDNQSRFLTILGEFLMTFTEIHHIRITTTNSTLATETNHPTQRKLRGLTGPELCYIKLGNVLVPVIVEQGEIMRIANINNAPIKKLSTQNGNFNDLTPPTPFVLNNNLTNTFLSVLQDSLPQLNLTPKEQLVTLIGSLRQETSELLKNKTPSTSPQQTTGSPLLSASLVNHETLSS